MHTASIISFRQLDFLYYCTHVQAEVTLSRYGNGGDDKSTPNSDMPNCQVADNEKIFKNIYLIQIFKHKMEAS